MSSLGPQRINLSFSSVLQVPGGLTSSLQPITDGNGIASGLQLSTTGVSGAIISDTVDITGGTIDATDIGSITPATGNFSTLTVDSLNGILKASSGLVSTAVSSVDYAPATTGTSILYGDGSGGFSDVTIGAGLLFSAGTLASTSSGGSVTNVSVATANGFAGTVANPSSTPAITLTTSVTGLLKGNGTAISAATSGTDYAPATSGTAILKGNGAGGFNSAAAGTDYAVPTSGTSILYGNGSGGFSNVTVGSGLSFATGTLSATGSMVYPGAGMAVSTGSAWGTSKATPTGDVVGTSDTQTLTNKTLTAAGSNTVEATSGPTSSQLAGNRNKIINGAMMIDQRNAGASVTPASAAYTLDRWQVYQATAPSKFSVQQNANSVSPPAGFSKYLGVTSLSAYSVGSGDYYSINQGIEGSNIADLNWGTSNAASVTLSFWVYSSLTGTFGGVIGNTSNRSYPFTYSISSANTWTKITVTIPGDTSGTWASDNSIGLAVRFGLGVGSTYSGTAGAWAAANYVSATGATSVVGTNGATFYITGVQLEKGATATPFENRLYGTELALCQRYYETCWNIGSVPGTYGGWALTACGGGGGTNTTSFIGQISVQYAVTKRSSPTVTTYDAANPPNSGKCTRYTLGTTTSHNESSVVQDNNNRGFNVYSGSGANAMGIICAWISSSEL